MKIRQKKTSLFKYKTSICFIICLLSYINLYSQFNIHGKVYDKISLSPIELYIVSIDGKVIGTITNKNGLFEINIKNGNNICFSAPGYNDTCIIIDNKNIDSINIYLSQRNINISEVKVYSNKRTDKLQSVQSGLVNIRTEGIRALPSLTGETDAFKILQLSPGVSKSDFSMGLNIRGSNSDQNMVLLDNGLIYNPTHLTGFLSVFNPLMIDRITLIKSGVPVEYGGRLSSVTIVETDKNLADKTTIEGNVGLILTSMAIKSPLSKSITVSLAGRISYIDYTLKPVSKILFKSNRSMFNTSLYGFYDLNATCIAKINNNNSIYFSTFNGKDNFYMQRSPLNFNYTIKWDNQMLSAQWNHFFNEKHTSKTTAYYTKSNLDLYFGQKDFYYILNSQNTDYSIQQEHNLFLSNTNQFKIGANIIVQRIIPNRSEAKINELQADFGTLNIFHTITLSTYLSDEFTILKKALVNIGIRASKYYHVGPYTAFIRDNTNAIIDTNKYNTNEVVKTYDQLEPRIALNYKYDSTASIKFSVGRYVQYLQQVNVSTVALPTDFWMPASTLLSPLIGYQISAGYIKNYNSGKYELSTEVFLKKMNNITEFKKGITSTVTKAMMEENILTGNGRAYGIEIMFEKKKGIFTGWVSYTLSRSERIFKEINNGKPFPSKYDRTHDISIVCQYNFKQNWIASAIFTFATGNAVTLPYGRYIIGGKIVNQYTEYNSMRMPPYHRLDISFTRKFNTSSKVKHEISFGVYNLYSRLNPYFMYFNVSGDLEKYKLKITPKYVSIFPLLPNFTYHFKF